MELAYVFDAAEDRWRIFRILISEMLQRRVYGYTQAER